MNSHIGWKRAGELYKPTVQLCKSGWVTVVGCAADRFAGRSGRKSGVRGRVGRERLRVCGPGTREGSRSMETQGRGEG